MHTPPFQSFRRQYPTASLTTELLMIHENQYVVKAGIAVEDRLLATGLAADAVLEAAENRACARAIQNLGVAVAPELVQPITAVSSADSPLELPVAPTPVTPIPAVSFPSQEPPKQEEFVSSQPDEEFLSVDWEEEPALPLVEVQATTQPSTHQQSLEKEPTTGVTTVLPEPKLPPSELVSPAELVSPVALGSTEPIDLSDIIAQTDVELRRLGWTVAQGREFLEKTYGKRSRHDLTDQELLEFLLYLEMQPPP